MNSLATVSLIDWDVAACGNKAAQLNRLRQHGYEVPRGVVVTAHGYELFVARNGLDQIVQEFIGEAANAPASRLVAIATRIKEAFLAAPMPVEIERPIRDWIENSRATLFAVRSSASNEDLGEASFAGQYDSFLNVESDSVGPYIARCFASLFNPCASLYRRRKGLTSLGTMAVIIQEMAPSDYAGVVFTRAPRRRDQLLIECAPGLADRVVSGSVSPNRYFINRQTLEVIEASEPHARDCANVAEVAALALALESDFQIPLDIEFGVKGGKIHILQARPISSAISSLS